MGCSTKVAYKSWVTEKGWHVKYYYFNGCEATAIPVKAGGRIKVNVIVNRGTLEFTFSIGNQTVKRTFNRSATFDILAKKTGLARIEICGNNTTGSVDVEW